MDEWRRLIERVEQRHGIVRFDDLVGAGCSPRQVDHLRETGRLVLLHRGVYRIAGAPPSRDAEMLAALRQVGDGGLAWIGGFTAAEESDLGVHARQAGIEVLRPHGLNARRAGIVVRRSRNIPPHHVTKVRGIDIVTPSRALVDIAGRVGPTELNRAVTRAIRSSEVACSLSSLYRVLFDLGFQGRPGSQRLREILDEWDPDEPDLESDLDGLGRALLGGVPGIAWQVEMNDERGYIRRVDALIEPARVVVEFDSIFHDDPAQKALDFENDRRLLDLGFLTRRLRKPDLTRRAALTLAEISRLARPAA